MQGSSEDPSKSNAADGSSNHAVNPSDEVVLISVSSSAHTHRNSFTDNLGWFQHLFSVIEKLKASN